MILKQCFMSYLIEMIESSLKSLSSEQFLLVHSCCYELAVVNCSALIHVN